MAERVPLTADAECEEEPKPMIKPSQIVLADPCPLTGTFGKAEVEAGAAFLLNALVFYGDKWEEVTIRQVGEAMRSLEGGDAPLWPRNPLLVPDIVGLVARGYARWTDKTQGRHGSPIEFTDKGIKALTESRWCVKEHTP